MQAGRDKLWRMTDPHPDSTPARVLAAEGERLWLLQPCPWLPEVAEPVRVGELARLGGERGEGFYRFSLGYAQSKWRQGLPAQALLQLNRAMSADLTADAGVLAEWPCPYPAVGWMMQQRPDRQGCFMGNPRRHWQHYATRMAGPRGAERIWRAWACWWIATAILPADEFPVDQAQIDQEEVVFPSEDEVFSRLRDLGWAGEAEWWLAALEGCRGRLPADA